MRKSAFVTSLSCTLILAAAVGSYAAKKGRVDETAWQGASPEDAAARLLGIGAELAEDGSWENIHLARVHYLTGETEKAERIWAKYSAEKAEAGDLIRIARVYEYAGEWDKARPLFDRVVELAPKDEDWLAEIGAFYNLNGDREHAEALFARAFRMDPRSLKNTLAAAGSYVGVEPRSR